MEVELDDPALRNAEVLRRVNVVGCSGGGKSTVSRRLASILGHPCIEMDALLWGPGWTEAEIPVFRERVSEALAASRWVLDGNYHSKTRDLKWARATLVVWIDLPFGRTLWQMTRRSFARAWDRRELWPGTGNRESFRRLFSRESMILWMLHSHPRLRKRYQACMAEPELSHLPFVRLRSHAQITAFEALARRVAGASSTGGA